MAAIYQRLQFRRGQAGHFAAHNPLLASGEPAVTMDTQVMKVGDGVKKWNDLPVFSSGVSDAAGAKYSELTTVSGMLDIASGIAVYSSGQQNIDVHKINAVSGIASTGSGISVFASGQTILLTASSGALNTSVGLLETSSGVLNTSVGLLEAASGALNTSVGLNFSNNTIVSGISVHSVSGSISYNSTASGNISGITAMLLVDQAAYNSLNKDSNTLYFIPSG